MAYLVKTTEIYRCESEDEAKKFIEEQKNGTAYEMNKYSSEYKCKKLKGEIQEEWYRVIVVKVFNDEKDCINDVQIAYTEN